MIDIKTKWKHLIKLGTTGRYRYVRWQHLSHLKYNDWRELSIFLHRISRREGVGEGEQVNFALHYLSSILGPMLKIKKIGCGEIQTQGFWLSSVNSSSELYHPTPTTRVGLPNVLAPPTHLKMELILLYFISYGCSASPLRGNFL